MKPQNLLYIMSDEHNPKMLGCYGHPLVKTPNLDRLAESGTRFTAAYTNSPICIPARAAFATGRYVHDTGYWDNAMPYDGEVASWGHRLIEEQLSVESIGKLHYRHKDLAIGISRQIEPMHVMDGIGQVWGAVRDPLPPKRAGNMLNKIGPGTSDYNRYDIRNADLACKWLKKAANRRSEKPWVLYIGFVAPHFPLVVPETYFNLYPLDSLPPRKLDPGQGFVRHPWLQRMHNFLPIDGQLSSRQRLMAVAAYFGLCTFVDHQIGKVLDTLHEVGLDQETRVIYTSDHGDNVGARGMWGKSNLYEESAGIPLIISGPDVPKGSVCRTPVTLVDSFQTVLHATGVLPSDKDTDLPGLSWFELAHLKDDQDRTAFSEYHAMGSPSAAYMIRKGRYKLINYVDYQSELFDLEEDPEETINLVSSLAHLPARLELETSLLAICDPDSTDRRAKDDQNDLVEKFGGRENAFNTGTPGATPVA